MIQCSDCGSQFQVDDAEKAFIQKVSPVIGGDFFELPLPSQCPECRLIHRLSFRNRRQLYRRQCPMTNKEILSMHAADSPFQVYDVGYWESDAFDATQYGRDFDFNRPFFEQFQELRLAVPRPNLAVVYQSLENADYINGATNVKNAYLSYSLGIVEDVYFSNDVYFSRNIVDCLYLTDSELCYECVDGKNLYHCLWTQDCVNSSSLWFCYDCRNCQNCFGSTGLRNKQYYIYNQPYSKEEFDQFMERIHFDQSTVEAMKVYLNNARQNQVQQHAHILYSENSTGDYISNAKNCLDCFNVGENVEDLKYCYAVKYNAKDVYDLSYFGQNIELVYQCQSVGLNSSNVLFSIEIYNQAQDILYSDTCYTAVNHLFGCVGIKRREYCILNKPYPKQEYESLLKKIIKHMKATGEWGKLFPKEMSPFAYNQSEVNYPFPKSKEEVLPLGYSWRDEKSASEFKLIPQELAFYQRMKIPHPTKHPEQRHIERFAQRTPAHLWLRNCDQCGVEMQSSYSPDRPEKVYCSQCYLAEMY